jgi:SSS family solute:Na+ symporter
VLHYSTDQAGNFWRAFVAFISGGIGTVLVSLVTKPKPVNELVGLVYSETPKPTEDPRTPWYERPVVLGAAVLVFAAILNVLFW